MYVYLFSQTPFFSSPAASLELICLNSCIYNKLTDEQGSGREYCFKSAAVDFGEVQCTVRAIDTTGVVSPSRPCQLMQPSPGPPFLPLRRTCELSRRRCKKIWQMTKRNWKGLKRRKMTL
jgi:hypothetical protein